MEGFYRKAANEGNFFKILSNLLQIKNPSLNLQSVKGIKRDS